MESFGGLPYGLTASAVLQGLIVGLLVSVLLALVPLLDVRRIKPLLLIRGAEQAIPPGAYPCERNIGRSSRGSRSPQRSWLWASWQAGIAWRAGAAVSVGFAAVSMVVCGAASALVRFSDAARLRPVAPAP